MDNGYWLLMVLTFIKIAQTVSRVSYILRRARALCLKKVFLTHNPCSLSTPRGAHVPCPPVENVSEILRHQFRSTSEYSSVVRVRSFENLWRGRERKCLFRWLTWIAVLGLALNLWTLIGGANENKLFTSEDEFRKEDGRSRKGWGIYIKAADIIADGCTKPNGLVVHVPFATKIQDEVK
jgi:hypothetical protein